MWHAVRNQACTKVKIFGLTVSDWKNYEKSQEFLEYSSDIKEHIFQQNPIFEEKHFNAITAIFSSFMFCTSGPGFSRRAVNRKPTK